MKRKFKEPTGFDSDALAQFEVMAEGTAPWSRERAQHARPLGWSACPDWCTVVCTVECNETTFYSNYCLCYEASVPLCVLLSILPILNHIKYYSLQKLLSIYILMLMVEG